MDKRSKQSESSQNWPAYELFHEGVQEAGRWPSTVFAFLRQLTADRLAIVGLVVVIVERNRNASNGFEWTELIGYLVVTGMIFILGLRRSLQRHPHVEKTKHDEERAAESETRGSGSRKNGATAEGDGSSHPDGYR